MLINEYFENSDVNACPNNGANNTSAIGIIVNNGHGGIMRFNRFEITLFTEFNSHYYN